MNALKWFSTCAIANLLLHIVLGIMYGNTITDLEGPAILTIAFGAPYMILRIITKKNGMAARSKPEWTIQDDKWQYSSKYGRDPGFAIATDDIKDYLDHVKKNNGEPYNWDIEKKINKKNAANYNFIDTEVTSVFLKDAHGYTDHLFFVMPGPRRSGHVPNGYKWAENGVEHDRTMPDIFGAQLESNTISQQIKPTNVTAGNDVVTTSDGMKVIPSDTLRKLEALDNQRILTEEEFKESNVSEDIPVEALKKLKDLYDAGIFTEEEFAEKKKRLLKL